ncbi:MAG: hypothetical protein KTR17_09455 [Cellvibrionaceae bacterium]|nr:hypothetical protein [Cellvibrionaceae bacterium]
MNIRTVLIACLMILVAANFFIRKENLALRLDIADKKNLCDQWLQKLALKQQNTPPSTTQARQTPTVKQAQTSASPSPEVENPPPETDIELLASHSHRMQAVNHKYEFIILTAQIDDDEKERLKKLLLLRERLSRQLVVAEQQEQPNLPEIEDKLYNIEDEIELVLNDPLDYYRYELIKQRPL